MPGKDPAFYKEDYPAREVGEIIADIGCVEPTGCLYQIDCEKCDMALRTQGVNIGPLLSRFKEKGCPVCGGKGIFGVRRVLIDGGRARE